MSRALVGAAYAVAEWWERDRPVARDALVDALSRFLVAGILASAV